MTRKEFLKIAAPTTLAILPASAFVGSTSARADTPTGSDSSSGADLTLKNDAFELHLKPGTGLIAKLTHLPSGTVLADGPYSYSFGDPAFAVTSSDASSATLTGTTAGGLVIEHRFRLPAQSPWIEEEIIVRNPTPALARNTFRCGFILPVQQDTLAGYTFTAIPFRREPRDSSHTYADYTLDQILNQTRRSTLREDSSPPRVYEDYISEGWAVTNGTTGFLITKYNQTAREFAILDSITLAGGSGLLWGGAGAGLSDCEGAIHIPAGAEHSFGLSRLTAFAGDLIQGHYAFRSEMESRGMGVPSGFNPPVHWNELYDNKLWWTHDPGGQDNPINRAKYYTLDDLKTEAAKAKAIGCGALYCDPGWDTNFASKIWDEPRLGKLSDFVALLKNDYGLKLSLHTPLSGWCNPSSYPLECFRVDKEGHRGSLCGASKQYVDETVRRLNVLAEAGVTYFMFDGTAYSGDPCWNPDHGHPLPLTCAAHVDATNLIARKVHETYPHVSIEMHDQVVGGAPVRYVPLYYGYGLDAKGVSGFDTIWAFEMMWSPMNNLMSGQSILLYYYNLAYSLPLYLHIDLRTDNDKALVFWWNASTCRYLGIGGTSTNPAVNVAHAAAMKTYLAHKACFAAGTFYGIDEMTHVHRHPTEASAVINCFNLAGGGTTKKISFNPAAFGLPTTKTYQFAGADFTSANGIYTGSVSIPPIGHQLIEVS